MNRSRILALVAGAAVASFVAAPAPPALAKDDIASRQYHENRIVGFRFRPMNEWAEVPAGTDPNDPSIGGFYSDKGKFRSNIRPTCEIYAFKRKSASVATGGAEPEEGGGSPFVYSGMNGETVREVVDKKRDRAYEMAEQLLARMDEKERKKVRGRNWKADPEEKEFKAEGAKDGKGTLILADHVIPTNIGTIVPAKIVAAFIENAEYEVGVMYWIPEEEWRRYARGLVDSASSLEFLETEKVEGARKDLDDALAGAKTDQDRWLTLIKSKVVKGWDHVQTENYLLIFDKEVKPDRVRLMAREIEAIRESVYEDLFPPEKPITAISVVRICKDKEQYVQYGGSQASAGYWSWPNRELVFYEDTGAKADSLRVLYHEAFHQYIFYSVGNISPHSWFNEGHGDYFSGHNYEPARRRFVSDKFSWRRDTVKNLLGTGKYVPLKRFVTYSQGDYYRDGGNNYSQGWSFIYFLRETRNPEWKNILPTYFDALKAEVRAWNAEQDKAVADMKEAGIEDAGPLPFIPPDVEERARKKALEAAFGDFDDARWERLEKEWKDFKY